MESLTMTTPYQAAMKENWSVVMSFYNRYIERMHSPLTPTGDTMLHVAVHYDNTSLLEFLVGKFEEENGRFPLPFQKTSQYGLTALHEAAAAGNLKAARLLQEKDPELLSLQTNKEETALFLAAAFGKTKIVKFLAPKIQDKRPHVRRKDGTSILHIAILGRHFKTAKELLKLEHVYPNMVDENGKTGFQLLANMPSAFKSGYRMGKLKALLYYYLPEVDYVDNDKEEIDSVSGENEDLETGNPQRSSQDADSPSVVSRVYNVFWRFIVKGSPSIKKMWGDKKMHTEALELAKILAEKDLSWKDRSSDGATNIKTTSDGASNEKITAHRDDKEEGDEVEKKEEKEGDDNRPQRAERPKGSTIRHTPLIAAASLGIYEIVEAILKVYPQAIEHVNDEEENIFHVVAKNRRTEILDLLQSPAVVVPKSRLWRKINVHGDSILHKAAYMENFSSRNRPGEALLMQSELQWFKRVQKIVPNYFLNHRNKDGKTAHELFTEQHKKLVDDGREWLKRTTEACTIVAVLIATIAFTCAYTVPGGSNKAGHPLLLKTTPFSVFTTSDTLSLCFSLTSVVVFLSISTSTMQEQNFRRSLPLKLVLGLTTLFFSVTAMMVAFSATLLLMIRQRLHWAAIPIYTIACCPVTIFLILQFPLYLDIAWFTVKDLFSG